MNFLFWLSSLLVYVDKACWSKARLGSRLANQSLNFLSAQNQELDFVISKNPINESYWWLDKNNFGRTPSSYDFQTQFKLINKKASYQASIYYNLDKQIDRGFFINESFIKYMFSFMILFV